MPKTHCPHCGNVLKQKFWEGRERLFCPNCRVPIYENPVPANCLVLVDDQNRLLLVKRNVEPKAGYWCLPGGFIELGEQPDGSALRELAEETGLSGAIDRLLGVITSNSDRYHSVLLVGYLVTCYSGTLSAGDDADDAAFFSPDQLPEIAFDSHRHFIRMYYEG